jgi:UDP-N-acetylmuramoylalanine--D-glutamate ligase
MEGGSPDRVFNPTEPVAVLGVGIEGLATIHYLKRRGVRTIMALDQQPIHGELPQGVASHTGPGYLDALEAAATIFRSPGIRPDIPALQSARRRGATVTSAINEFLAHCPAKLVGVTGTVGKGTASTLIFEMLRKSGIVAHLAGNIGKSPLDLIESVQPTDVVVLEISSFQAMDLIRSPQVCVVLKTTSEHLDWHTSLAEYRQAKAGLVRHQSAKDAIVYCADAQGSEEVAAQSPAQQRWAYSLGRAVERGAYREGERFVVVRDGQRQVLSLSPTALHIAGAFNQENVLAALLCALSAGAALEPCLEAAEQFEGLPHRLELCARSRTVRFFNDSYATRPEATIGALSCFSAEPVALILGGSEKHADFGPLAAAVAGCPNLVHVALIGQTSPRLREALAAASPSTQLPIVASYLGLEPAMEACTAALRKSGGVVLMSPACASFGLFPNYKVRGETFRALAKRLAASLR